ncbi:MAG TPA: hypothetical protein VGB37_00720 [Candidatus Lokiarchaeia archaeon]
MPIGIFLYEIDKSLGPQVIAEYYTTQEKVTQEILKIFTEKHIRKDLSDATYRKDNFLFYSSIIQAISDKTNFYLGFILKEDEDFISLKSIFENLEQSVANNFAPKDKKKMQLLLKDILTTTINLFEKLKEPKIIKDAINERTKKMLDDGKLQEARELIDLGEKIPEKLSQEMMLAEQALKEKNYRKAKNCYFKAAELAGKIKESEVVDLLKKKGEHVGTIPDLLKTREVINKGIKKSLEDLQGVKLEVDIYDNLVPLVEKNIKLSYSLEDTAQIETLEKLIRLSQNAFKRAQELKDLDEEIIELLKKIQ